MSESLTRAEAIEYLGIGEKAFNNYFKDGQEFPCMERIGKGRFRFDREVLRRWKEGLAERTIQLTREDYVLSLDFALAQHFKSYVLSDFGSGRQREFGQKITNWIKGQLGEIAVQKFLKKEFGVEVALDFNIHDAIVPQDIIGIREKGVLRSPRIGVGIKSSKPKNVFLVLGENEVQSAERRSDVYIFVRVDTPDDHLLRIVREKIAEIVSEQPYYPSYKAKMAEFSNIPCEIAGWCNWDELDEATSIPGQTFENGPRYVIASGRLKKSKDDWAELTRQL